MNEKPAARRSYRLKDKTPPNYVYEDYLKVAIHSMSKSPKKTPRDRSVSFGEEDDLIEEYSSSGCSNQKMAAETAKKYDDIFDAVVANAFMMDVKKTPEQYFFKAAKRKRKEREEREAAGVFRPKEPTPEEPEEKQDAAAREDPEEEKEDDEDDVIVVTEVKRPRMEVPPKTSRMEMIILNTFACSCGRQFDQHSDCHQHIYDMHGDDEFDVHCEKCGQRLNEIREKNVCSICGIFAAALEEHMASHYRNCTAKSAVMECRFCTKQFMTVKEVMAHEQTKHFTKAVRKTKQIFKCNECFEQYENQELLGVHYSDHLDLNLLATKIAELQYKVQAEKEECPFCRVNMSSRKTFRAHYLRAHYPACKSMSARPAPVIPEDQVKKELQELIDISETLTPVKQEVKEEILDDGY